MKKVVLIVNLAGIILNFANAQNIDSLKRELTRIYSDSIIIDIHNELAFAYAGIDPNIGLVYADSALRLAERTKHKRKIANSLNSFGVNYWYLGKDSLAFSAYKKVLDIYLEFGDELGQARMYNNLALLAYNSADYATALRYHDIANEIFERENLTGRLINSLSNTGVVFLAINDYARALTYFLRALGKTDSTSYAELGNLHTNIGLVYKNQKEYDHAATQHEAAIKCQELAGNNLSKAQALSNLGTIYQLQGKFEDALNLYQEALKINGAIGNERRIASDYANLGVLYRELKEYGDASKYLRQSKDIFQKVGDQLNLSIVLLELAEVMALEEKTFSEVLTIQQLSLSSAEKAQSLLGQMNAWQAISRSLEKLNQDKNAFQAFKKHLVFKDSIFNEENSKALIRLQATYDLEIREKDLIASHQLETQRLRAETDSEILLTRIYLVTAAVGILIILLLVYFYARENEAQKEKIRAEFEAKKSQLELKALRAQMDPHFIFNALSSISNYLLQNDAEKADYYLTRFSKLIRMVLHSSDKPAVPLLDELELIENYIEIESMRMGRKIHFNISNLEGINLANVSVPPMLIQPLVENAIWHGISKVDRDGIIEVKFHHSPAGISIKVRDNGGGLAGSVTVPQGDQMKGGSMGLQLIENRLGILKADSNGNTPQISWENLPQGVEVGIELPIST